MIYCGTEAHELIILHPEDDVEQHAFVDMCKDAHDSTFTVLLYNENNFVDKWSFCLDSNTTYERVKLCIFDIADEVDTFEELYDCINEVFAEYFGDMFVDVDVDYDSCNGCSGLMS